MKRLSKLTILLLIGYNIFGQTHYKIDLEGSQTMNNIEFEYSFKIIKVGGDWLNTTITIQDINKIKSYENTVGIHQIVQEHTVTLTPAIGATLSNSIETNIDGTTKLKYIIVVDGSVINSNVVELKVKFNAYNEVNIFQAIEFKDPCPLIVSGYNQYLSSTNLIPANNPNIVNTALQLTKRKKNALDAVDEIGKYMKANIKDSVNADNNGLAVYNNAVGDCDGQAHLMSAFLRCLGIPTRICGGYFVDYGFNIYLTSPFNQNIHWGGTGSGTSLMVNTGHAWLEFYLPNTGWIRCDPAQNTLYMGWANALKDFESSSESDLIQGSISTSSYGQGSAPNLTASQSQKYNVLGSFNTNFNMVNYDDFSGTSGDNVLFTANSIRKPLPSCIDCSPDEDAPQPPILFNASVITVASSKYVHLSWSEDVHAY